MLVNRLSHRSRRVLTWSAAVLGGTLTFAVWRAAPKYLGWMLIGSGQPTRPYQHRAPYCEANSVKSTTNETSPSGRACTHSTLDASSADCGGSSSARACTQDALSSGYQLLTVDGKTRRFLFEPAVNTSGLVPLVFVFHGIGSDGSEIAQHAQLSERSCRSMAVVYPEATEVRPGRRAYWDCFSSTDTSDTRFVDAILAWADDHACVDKTRIFAVGFSAGGWMASHLGCTRPKVFRGIVPIAAGAWGKCELPVAAMVMHSRDDDTASISLGWRGLFTWRSLSNCSSSSHAWPSGPCEEFRGCVEHAPVLWCEYPGGHRWPPNATRAILDWVTLLDR